MPEIVTDFQPIENPKTSLKNMAHRGIPPTFLPTKIREEPFRVLSGGAPTDGGCRLVEERRPSIDAKVKAPMHKTSISELFPAAAVKVAGRVDEIFGNKYILQDETGRALIELGPEGHDAVRGGVGQSVTVEGRFKEGFIHADAVTTPDGRRIELRDGKHGPKHGPGLHREDKPKDAGFDEDVALAAAAAAGYRDARVRDVKKHHAEVAATSAEGKQYELHIEFDGAIRKAFLEQMSEAEVKTALDAAGYAYDGEMRPEKKHFVVAAKNPKGKAVRVDVHRDGSIKKEEPR